MILYNITVIIDESISDQWLDWIQNDHLPEIMATELFESFRLLKVLDSPNEGVTYCIQLIVENEEKYGRYLRKFEPQFRSQHINKFGNSLVIFPSAMEFIAHI
jgi:hypothetical protein